MTATLNGDGDHADPLFTAAAAVAASGLLTRPGVPELHRAALAASRGGPVPAAAPDTAPGADTDTPPAISADTAADTARTRTRTPRRTGRPETGKAVARLRDRHPDMPAADIARRMGVSDRTVRRHLSPRPAADLPAITA